MWRRVLELLDQILQHHRHATQFLCNVTLVLHGDNLRVEEFLRDLVEILVYLYLRHFLLQAFFVVIALPERKTILDCIVQIDDIFLPELELVNEPF